jgi:nicotinamidase-related amidase
MSKLKLLSVDLQKDFSAPGGKHYKPHASVDFIKQTLIPFAKGHGLKIAEIISDYRQPRPGDRDDSCNPGTTGYESEVPDEQKLKPVWVKCMNSPIWVREGGGDPSAKPGLPYQDPATFTKWLESAIGKPEEVEAIVLVGLTIDCCVLCTAQELSFRAYKVKVLAEAVDVYSGDAKEKEAVLNSPILRNWAEVVTWSQLERELAND